MVEAIATAMEGNRDHKHKDDSKDRIDWSTVKQLMVEKHGVPFEDLCVRLPYSMGPFITGRYLAWLKVMVCDGMPAGPRIAWQYVVFCSCCL